MKTIVMASQKGGSGKTTLTAHLAVEAERCKETVWVIDTDKQASLSRWHGRREADTPHRLDVPFNQVPNAIAKAAEQGATFCFIDTAPTDSQQNRALLQQADLVVVPVRPSPNDLWSVADTVEAIKEAGKPFMFVIMQAKPQATITAQAIAALSKHGQVAEAFIADRVTYAAAMTSGNTAPELAKKGSAAEEIAALWTEIKSSFNEIRKSGKKIANG